MGMGKGLLDSLIAEGGVKSRVIYIGVVIEIGKARIDRNAAKFLWLSLLHFLFRRNFLCSLVNINMALPPLPFTLKKHYSEPRCSAGFYLWYIHLIPYANS